MEKSTEYSNGYTGVYAVGFYGLIKDQRWNFLFRINILSKLPRVLLLLNSTRSFKDAFPWPGRAGL